jgi:surface antigen
VIKKIKGKTLYLALSVVLSAVGFFVLLSQPAFATDFIQDPIGSAVATVVGLIAYVIVYVLGNILSLLISVLVNVAQFNNIINVPTVVEGWVIIRDLCNMVFILALLVIAFATILRVEGYSLKKLLPKLLIAAILINFSRTIFGLIIDFSQIIMLTFVQGFSGHGAGHLVDFFQVKDVLAIWDGNDDENLKAWSIAGGIIAGVIAVIISVIVVSVLLAVLVVRVVMLWVYTILSPLIFLGMAFPPLKSYTSSLWQDFVKQIMVGPIIAFFIWLAVVTIETSSQALDDMVPSSGSGEQVCAGVNQFFCENSFQTYILAIAFLMGGLVVAQKVGSVTAKAAGKAEAFSKNSLRRMGRKSWEGTQAAGGELWAQSQKTASGRRLAAVGERFRHADGAKAGAAAGAAVGTAFMPVGGTLVGAGLGAASGALFGKKATDTIKKRRQRFQKLAKAAEDRGEVYTQDGVSGRWNEDQGAYLDSSGNVLKDENGHRIHRWGEYEEGGARYRRVNEAGEMRRVNSAGNYIKQEGNREVEVGSLEQAEKASISAMTEKQAGRWSMYESRKHKGWAAKDTAEDEMLGKGAQQYMHQSNEVLRRMFEMEKDSRKKTAQALALAMKKGFKETDYKKVNEAKGMLGENPLLQKRFNDEMNKRHMVLNNTRDDGTIDEAAIAKLVSSGAASWKDQEAKTMTRDGLKIMAKQTGSDFRKTLDSMIKTDKDKKNVVSGLAKDLDGSGFEGEDLELRKAYGELSGQYLKAFERNGEIQQEHLENSLRRVSNSDVFADIDNQVLDKPEFKQAFANTADIGMLKKISNNQKIDIEKANKYMRIAQENTRTLAKMRQDSNLKHYVT